MVTIGKHVKVSKEGGMLVFSSREPMFNPEDCRITYGDKLEALLNRHKIVHVNEIARDANGKFRTFTYEVGG